MFENHVLHSKTVFMLGDTPNVGTSNCKESCVELEEQEAALCKAVHLKKIFFFATGHELWNLSYQTRV